MDFAKYQKLAIKTDLSVGASSDINSRHFFDKLLGLVGETGEIAEKFKKIYRDQDGKFTPNDKAMMQKELGDVLWYLSVICSYIDIDLNQVAQDNIDKLQSRQQRGKLSGSGDNR